MSEWVFRHRGFLAILPIAVATFSFFDETEDDLIIWPAGVVLILAGILLRLWAQQHLHHRLKLPLALTNTGPYAFVRNPLYWGNTLIFIGATVCSELLWLVPITLAWCALVYSLTVRHEEARLLANYGDLYRDYRQRVPRWFPLLAGGRSWQFVNGHLRASLVAESHCLLLVFPFLIKEIVSRWIEH